MSAPGKLVWITLLFFLGGCGTKSEQSEPAPKPPEPPPVAVNTPPPVTPAVSQPPQDARQRFESSPLKGYAANPLQYFTARKWRLVRPDDTPPGSPLNLLVPPSKNQQPHVILTLEEYYLLSLAPEVERLNLMRVEVADAGLAQLAKMPGLKHLALGSKAYTDAGLKALASSPSLETVSLTGIHSLTDAGVRELGRLPRLERLHILGAALTGECFAGFSACPNLKAIDIQLNDRLTDAGAVHLSRIKGLEELKLTPYQTQAGLTRAGILAIASSGNLPVFFSFDHQLADDEVLIALIDHGWLYGPCPKHLEELRPLNPEEVIELNFMGMDISDQAFAKVLDCVYAERISLSGPKITEKTIRELSRFEELIFLELNEVELGEDSLKALTELPLERLLMSNCTLTDANMQAIGQTDSLLLISLNNCQFDSASFQHFTGLSQLVELDLARSSFQDAGAAYLAQLPKLRGLSLDDTALTDRGLDELVKAPALNRLSLHKTQITEGRYRQVKAGFPQKGIYARHLERGE